MYNPSQADRDRDNVGNPCDNCPFDYNPNQEDIDKDEKGDACDEDKDNDGYSKYNCNFCAITETLSKNYTLPQLL